MSEEQAKIKSVTILWSNSKTKVYNKVDGIGLDNNAGFTRMSIHNNEDNIVDNINLSFVKTYTIELA